MTALDYFLSEEQNKSIEELLRLLGPEAAANSYCTRFNVLRWINAYKNVEEAARLLKRHLTIRKIKSLDMLADSLDEFDETVSKYFPIQIIGRNKNDDNKVLVCEPTGRIDIHSLLGLVQITPFMKNRFRIMEKILKKINDYEEETRRISGGILLIDLDGLSLHPSLVKILKGPYRIMWGTLFEQYPEMFSRIIVINAPSFMNILWTACIPFIDAEVRSKILITTRDSREEIFQHIDPSCLPICYGGTLSNPNSCNEIPPSELFPQPIVRPIVPLKKLTIPAGRSLIQVYQFDKDMEIEFYLNHHDDFTLVVRYSAQSKNADDWNEKELEEVYAACERPGLETTDYWKWKTPYTGYYYLCFGNEKAWFLSVSVEYLVTIYNPTGAIPILPVAEF